MPSKRLDDSLSITTSFSERYTLQKEKHNGAALY